MEVGARVNPKNQQGGKYTTLKNGGDPKKYNPHDYAHTPLGTELTRLSRKWNQKIFGDAAYDGFDFKINLSDKPFTSAVMVLEPSKPPQKAGSSDE
jgi:hypothetical protein